MGCSNNEARGGAADDVGGSDVIEFNALPTIESPKGSDIKGTNDEVDVTPLLEVQENEERSPSLLGAPRFFP